jgi:hypothetical protein
MRGEHPYPMCRLATGEPPRRNGFSEGTQHSGFGTRFQTPSRAEVSHFGGLRFANPPYASYWEVVAES